MTKKEVGTLIGLAVGSFPNMSEKDMRPTAKLWEMMLIDIPYTVAEQALLRVLSTAKFFPTIAEIKEAIVDVTEQPKLTAIEAWGEVMKAVRNFGYSRPAEALASMSEETRSIVKSFGWLEICQSEEVDVIRGQFRMAYEAQVKRDKERQVAPALPEEKRAALKQMLDGIGRLPERKGARHCTD